MCLYPKLIKNRKYTSNTKNGGIVPTIQDERTKYVPIGCQNCMECRKQKARGWQVRLLEDIKTHKNGKFVTLTFSNESIKKLTEMKATKYWPSMEGLEGYELDNEIATRATRLFLERWRKEYGTSIRHWLVTEIGHQGTENIHIHGIIWTDHNLEDVERIWKYGWVWKGKKQNGKLINYVNEQTVNYIVKYIHKQDEQHTTYRGKILTSDGIGKNYTTGHDYKKNNYNGTTTIETYRTRSGYKIAMPIYWRNKIYNDTEREKLWLQRLDKNERWVNGEKVSTKNGYENYYKLLKWHQEQNKKLGYGDDKQDWSKKQYEKERRQLMIKTRIAEATEKKTNKEKHFLSQEQQTVTIGNSKWIVTENGIMAAT